ncbi:hypothetical protein [Uliginosibacterium sediminicola]|uniref:Transposase n=1 Tax=Uliginosibacterium sediminicola TaxID=2024550 RepID=A0ABU9Z2P9_9RHOO
MRVSLRAERFTVGIQPISVWLAGDPRRRYFLPVGIFFFTVNYLERSRDLLVRHVALLRDVVRQVRAARAFEIVAWVVMPDHSTLETNLPPGDTDTPERWRPIKLLREFGAMPFGY